jgi:hypothetical protein
MPGDFLTEESGGILSAHYSSRSSRSSRSVLWTVGDHQHRVLDLHLWVMSAI